MTPDEAELRREICLQGQSLFIRGLTSGSSGNISARVADGFLVTPTNSCLGTLEPERLSKLSPKWEHVSGDRPTKEIPLHRAFYDARPETGAVVHLHSSNATALSCLEATDPTDAIPPITPYVVMRVGRVPMLPFTLPGDAGAEPMFRRAAQDHAALLLANHGPVVSGRSLRDAAFAIEELEEAAKLVVLTIGQTVRLLPKEVTAELRKRWT